jgi:hypothetical protein
VPVSVYDGQNLQDGGIYLARPQPLALESEVEYQLQQNGKNVGLFEIQNAGREQGSWVGHGAWKPLPAARPAEEARASFNQPEIDDEGSDRPVLHRKAHPGDAPASGTSGGAGSTTAGGSASGGGSGSGSAGQAPAADPDRPTLHRTNTADTTGDAGSGGTGAGGASAGGAGTTTASSGPAPDPDRPTLHRSAPDDDSASANAPANDADRSKLKKKKQEDEGYVESMPEVTDPDRPRLLRGKPTGEGLTVAPTLMGLPPDMHQEVAVSDVRNRPEHPWNYTWANPGDEAKMKADLDQIARDALGLTPPPAPPAPPPKHAVAHKNAKPAPTPPPPSPAPLLDEQFQVFELAYGSGATMVLSAHTEGAGAQEKFVTLIAQPDLYGNVVVLLKSVTDAAHLDDTPRMRLVDAVDAMADNRGELLFELRGATQRQFVLYRVLRAQVSKLFASGVGVFGSATSE